MKPIAEPEDLAPLVVESPHVLGLFSRKRLLRLIIRTDDVFSSSSCSFVVLLLISAFCVTHTVSQLPIAPISDV